MVWGREYLPIQLTAGDHRSDGQKREWFHTNQLWLAKHFSFLNIRIFKRVGTFTIQSNQQYEHELHANKKLLIQRSCDRNTKYTLYQGIWCPEEEWCFERSVDRDSRTIKWWTLASWPVFPAWKQEPYGLHGGSRIRSHQVPHCWSHIQYAQEPNRDRSAQEHISNHFFSPRFTVRESMNESAPDCKKNRRESMDSCRSGDVRWPLTADAKTWRLYAVINDISHISRTPT
jgi:hypothetical protein